MGLTVGEEQESERVVVDPEGALERLAADGADLAVIEMLRGMFTQRPARGDGAG